MRSSPVSAEIARAPARAERFWNLPNTITVVRTAVVPILLLFPLFSGPTGSRIVAWLFIVAALSDLLDGWLARRGQQVTRIGKLLDPLADKLLVSAALIVLVGIGRIPPWLVWMVVGALLFPDPTLGLPAHAIGLVFLTLATALTLWSGYVYFRDYFDPQGRPGSGGAEA
jgi:CDP-diacylglycerol--glycerol-3-phosphate 3-phosphatidyltransferase